MTRRRFHRCRSLPGECDDVPSFCGLVGFSLGSVCGPAKALAPRRLRKGQRVLGVCLRSWDGFKTANTAGVFLQVGSVPMMAVSMKAFMCYKHPNNLRSLVSYPNVFCGDGDQVIMMLVGLVAWFTSCGCGPRGILHVI